MIKSIVNDTCEVKTQEGRCPNPAVGIVFDNLLCCQQHRLDIYTAWAERASGEVILH